MAEAIDYPTVTEEERYALYVRERVDEPWYQTTLAEARLLDELIHQAEMQLREGIYQAVRIVDQADPTARAAFVDFRRQEVTP